MPALHRTEVLATTAWAELERRRQASTAQPTADRSPELETPAHGEGHTLRRHLRSLRDGRRTRPVSVQPAPVTIDTCFLPACAGNAVVGGKPQVPAQSRQ